MRELIRRYEVWVALSAILSVNALFVGAIASDVLPKGLYTHGRFLLLGFTLFGVIFICRGWHGVRDVLVPMIRWRQAPIWYLLAISWGSLISVVVLLFKGAINGNGIFEVTVNLDMVRGRSIQLTLFLGSFIGEIVWVSYAIRRLATRFTVFVSAMIVGVVWTCWWLPMVYYGYGVVEGLPPVALLINQSGVAAMCAFMYWHTKSGIIVLLMQMMFNAAILVFPVAPTSGGLTTYWIFAIVYFFSALMLFLVFGPKPLFVRASEHDHDHDARGRKVSLH